MFISLASALIGGICTLIGGVFVYRKQEDSQREQNAAVLYNDLISIEKYLKYERGSVNIRFYNEWQHIVAKCTFLKPREVELIYNIYDSVYNYNYHYRLLEKKETVRKDNINEYNCLKN